MVPVSFDSAGTPFDMAENMPSGANAFIAINPNPFDIRLEASRENFVAVTPTTGWMFMARTMMGPFTSTMPRWLSVLAVSTKAVPLAEDYDFTDCFIEFVYGEGQ